MSLYLAVKYLHILLAIIAVGFSGSYAFWIFRSRGETQTLLQVLSAIRFMDSRFTNPAFLLLLLTGLAMAFMTGLPLTTFWISAAVALYVMVALVGMLLYAPAFRQLRNAARDLGVDSDAFNRALRRTAALNALAGFLVLLILFLMVFKP